MPRKNMRRAASKEALKQMQLLSSSAYNDEEDKDTETFEITSEDEDVINIDMPPKKKYRLSHRKSSDGNDRDVIVLKTVNTQDATLKLDAWVEELDESQLKGRSKVQNELNEVDTKLRHIQNQLSAEVLYQGESTTVYQLDNAASPFTPDNKKKITTIAASKTSQPNIVLQQSSSGNATNAYQLVMDPRLGLIVGTMTPAPSTSLPPPLTKTQTSVTTPVQPRQTRRRGKNSSVLTPVQPALPKIQKTPQIPSTSLIPLRPTESTAVGGLSTTSEVIPKPSPNKSINNIVDLTTDDGRPAADSREISFNKLQGKTYPSLVVVARPHLSVKDITGGDRSKLDAKVKSVLMHVPTKFTEWLIQQGLVRSEQNCQNHPNTKLKLGMYSDVSKFPYSGGYVWISECCPHRFVSVFSGSLFEGSSHPPSVILKLIYHWACQTNVQNVVQWVKVENLYVKGMNTWLRALCSVALQSHVAPLGGPGRRVEVGVISLGTTSQDGQQRQVKVEVLGLLETDLKRIRLRAVEPLADGDRNYKRRFSKILEPLLNWVHPESIIVTDLTVDKYTLQGMGFGHVLQTTSSEHCGNHAIMEYLRRIVPRMFQNTLSLLSRQIIQQFLDELVWREWFGTTAVQCFDNILLHLSEQTRADTGQPLIVRLNKVAGNPFKNWAIKSTTQPTTIISKSNDATLLPTKRTSNRQRKSIVKESSPPIEIQQPQPHQSIQQPQRPLRTISPDVPEQMVPLENYYYGTIEGHDPNANVKISWSIKCSMCKSQFNNNIKLMTHLFSHAHSITAGMQQCQYCLSSVGSEEGLIKHIQASHPSKTKFKDGFICVICETRFANFLSLGKHLSKEHVPAELPYQCGTCNYRSSSHRQAIDHFYRNHNNGGTIQCPFCLKSTAVWNTGRILPQNLNFFMQHLQKHQKKALAKKCTKCALWFINKDTLKDHLSAMHGTQKRKAGLVPWSSPRNGLMVPKSKQDKQAWEDTEREINLSNLTIDAPKSLMCKECKSPINTPHHYQSLDSCPNRNCQYLTSCKEAMDTHVSLCKNLNSSLPLSVLPTEMFCVCGYSEDDGNLLAKHLAQCERKSAYPSSKTAKLAIKTHSMLDVLGLVRRPEEPTTNTSTVDIINIDDNDDSDHKVDKVKTPKTYSKMKKKRSAKDTNTEDSSKEEGKNEEIEKIMEADNEDNIVKEQSKVDKEKPEEEGESEIEDIVEEKMETNESGDHEIESKTTLEDKNETSSGDVKEEDEENGNGNERSITNAEEINKDMSVDETSEKTEEREIDDENEEKLNVPVLDNEMEVEKNEVEEKSADFMETEAIALE